MKTVPASFTEKIKVMLVFLLLLNHEVYDLTRFNEEKNRESLEFDVTDCLKKREI